MEPVTGLRLERVCEGWFCRCSQSGENAWRMDVAFLSCDRIGGLECRSTEDYSISSVRRGRPAPTSFGCSRELILSGPPGRLRRRGRGTPGPAPPRYGEHAPGPPPPQ